MKPAITCMIRVDALETESFARSFQVLDSGRYLIDQNDDLWILIDKDGTHNVYARLKQDHDALENQKAKLFN